MYQEIHIHFYFSAGMKSSDKPPTSNIYIQKHSVGWNKKQWKCQSVLSCSRIVQYIIRPHVWFFLTKILLAIPSYLLLYTYHLFLCVQFYFYNNFISCSIVTWFWTRLVVTGNVYLIYVRINYLYSWIYVCLCTKVLCIHLSLIHI